MKDLIKITGDLRLNELQSVAKSTLQIVEPFKLLASSKLIVAEKLALFVEGMEKTKTKQDRRHIDNTRDKVIVGLTNQIKANDVLLRMDGYESSVAALNTLMQIYDKHGVALAKMPYDDETSAIENYIAQLKTLSDEFLTISNVAVWIPILETANENFKNTSLEKISLITEEDSIIAASGISGNLIIALNELYTFMFAQLVINSTPELNKAYNELTTMIDSL